MGQIDRHGLRRFLLEDAVPANLLGYLVRAVVADDDAEALRRELRVGDPAEACTMLMDRAVEALAIGTPIPRRLLASG